MRRNLPAGTGYGLLGGVALLLVVTPTFMLCAREWGYYPHSVGLPVRLTAPTTIVAAVQPERVVVSLRSAECHIGGTPELRLNSRPISRGELRSALRCELSLLGNPIVYVEGTGCLTVADVVHVIDIARDAWYGVPVVLVTPGLTAK